MKETFTREDTKLVKGVAVVLMLVHHLWVMDERLPQRLNSYISFFGTTELFVPGCFGQICVSLFFFLWASVLVNLGEKCGKNLLCKAFAGMKQ